MPHWPSITRPCAQRCSTASVAEKLRDAAHSIRIDGLAVGASFGVAAFPDDGADGDTLLRMADRALYSAKRAGRDRVELATT